HRTDGGGLAHHGREPDVPRGAAAVIRQLLFEQAVLTSAIGQELQLLQVHRLFDVVEGAELDGFDGALDGAVGRQHDHGEDGIELADPLEQVDAAHAGEAHVREHDVRLKTLQQL